MIDFQLKADAHSHVIKFILDNQDLINANSFDILYEKASTTLRGATSFLTAALESSGIDPLQYLHYVPARYKIWDSYTTNFILPDHIERIDKYAFYSSDLESIEFNKNLDCIGISAFENCGRLFSIHLSPKLTTLKSQAFKNCDSLKSVIIPKSLKNMGSEIFAECGDLEYLDYSGTTQQWLAINKAEDWPNNSYIRYIQCIDGVVDDTEV